MVKAEGWYDKGGSKWKTLPELMFMYRSASYFSNVHCPETKLGMATVEELRDIVPMDKQGGVYQRTSDNLEALKEKIFTPAEAPTEIGKDEIEAMIKEITKLRSPGLKAWEEDHRAVYELLPGSVRRYFESKWMKVIGSAYLLDEQPPVPHDPEPEAAPEPEPEGVGVEVLCAKNEAPVKMKVCEEECPDRPGCPSFDM
jgi:hypothetical protein